MMQTMDSGGHMNTHTPGPWHAEACENNGTLVYHRVVAGDSLICGVYGSQEANAAFIIRACNAHEELLAACELFTKAAHDARDALNGAGLACPSSIAFAAEQARAAISKATQEAVGTKNFDLDDTERHYEPDEKVDPQTGFVE
jgi:hypothetical protein